MIGMIAAAVSRKSTPSNDIGEMRAQLTANPRHSARDIFRTHSAHSA